MEEDEGNGLEPEFGSVEDGEAEFVVAVFRLVVPLLKLARLLPRSKLLDLANVDAAQGFGAALGPRPDHFARVQIHLGW